MDRGGGARELQTAINVRVDSEQCVMGQLILNILCMQAGTNGKVNKKASWGCLGSYTIVYRGLHYHSTAVPSLETGDLGSSSRLGSLGLNFSCCIPDKVANAAKLNTSLGKGLGVTPTGILLKPC